MRRNNKNSGVSVLLTGALLVGVLLFAFFSKWNRVEPTTAEPDEAETTVTDTGESPNNNDGREDLPSDGGATINSNTVEEPETSECISIAAFVQSPEAYRLDKWFTSWGAPPISNLQLSSRPYAQSDTESLRERSGSGDFAAMHELGLQLVWAALTSGDMLPDYRTLLDAGSEDIQYARDLDEVKLKQGRHFLYEAALGGRLFALSELGSSYTYELVARQFAGTLADAQRHDLQIKAFGFGELPENLIDGLDPAFYQAKLPDELKSEADRFLRSAIEAFHSDRHERGIENKALPVASDKLDSLEHLCGE